MPAATIALVVLLIAAIGVVIYMLTSDLPSGGPAGKPDATGNDATDGTDPHDAEVHTNMRRAHWAIREAWQAATAVFNDEGGLASTPTSYATLSGQLRSAMQDLVDVDSALSAATEDSSTTQLTGAKEKLESAKTVVDKGISQLNERAQALVIGDSTLLELMQSIQSAIGRTLSYVAAMISSGDVAAEKDWDALVPGMTSEELLASVSKMLANVASVGGKLKDDAYGLADSGYLMISQIRDAGEKLKSSAGTTKGLVDKVKPHDSKTAEAAIKAAIKQATNTQIRVQNVTKLKKYIGNKSSGQNKVAALTPVMRTAIALLKIVQANITRYAKEWLAVRGGRPCTGLDGLSA